MAKLAQGAVAVHTQANNSTSTFCTQSSYPQVWERVSFPSACRLCIALPNLILQHFAGWLSEVDGMSMSLKQLLLHRLNRKDVVV